MLTTSHACIGYLLFEKKPGKARWLAVIGSVIPDAVFFVVMPWLFLTDFNSLQSSFTNQTDVYANSIDFHIGQTLNSLWLWMLCIALGRRWKWLYPIGIGGFVHIVVDALTHKGSWAWNHFYPIPVEPLQGIVDFTEPWFFVPVHILWIIIFVPKIYKHIRM